MSCHSVDVTLTGNVQEMFSGELYGRVLDLCYVRNLSIINAALIVLIFS